MAPTATLISCCLLVLICGAVSLPADTPADSANSLTSDKNDRTTVTKQILIPDISSDADTPKASPSTSTAAATAVKDDREAAVSSPGPSTSNATATNPLAKMTLHNWEAVVRSSYVFGGLCLLAILYLSFRTWRLRRRRAGARRTGSRKYLPLSTSASRQGNQHEMEPLGMNEEDDGDEDTLFDTSSQAGLQRLEDQS